jgi:hypothetical protein
VTDYVFGDDLAVGKSLAVVVSAAAGLSALLLMWGCRHFRSTVAVQNADEYPPR